MSLTDKIHQQIEAANDLHAGIGEEQCDHGQSPSAALINAWQAGIALTEAKRLLKKLEGHGTWEQYAEDHFHGSLSTAVRYMQLAKSFTTVKDLPPTSLVEAYRQLGMIATPGSPKTPNPPSAPKAPGRALPPGKHIVQARSLATLIRTTVDSCDARKIERIQKDFDGLRREMERLYSGGT